MRTVTVDEKKRVRIPTAQPGQVFLLEPNADGSLTLRELQPRRAKARLEKKGGFTVAVSERPITQEQVRALLDEFP